MTSQQLTAPDPGAAPADAPTLTAWLRHWAGTRGMQRAFTFVDHPAHRPDGVHRTVTWSRLDRRARAVGAAVAATAGPGERAALLLPQGLDYVTAFLGCLYAGVTAVPLFPPDLPGHGERLAAVVADCRPACLLTAGPAVAAVEAFAAARGLPLLRTDQVPDSAADGAAPAAPRPEDTAYLQYTSGSTRTPAGVMISHRNVVANARQALAAYHAEDGGVTTVGWLPLFHDMGLVLSVAAPVVGGLSSVLMDPVAFLQRPARWLRLLGQYPDTVSAAPNFAYDYCAARTTEEERCGLRLDRVKALINGSEPIRAGTVDRFLRTFAAHGLRPDAHCASYGLAEATVLVTADPPGRPPATVALDRAALADGRALPAGAASDAVRLVSCGRPVGQRLLIADPDTGAPLPDGTVGEIRVQGPNVGGGYWGRPEKSAETFGTPVAEAEGGWLRTGDLGVLHEGRLLVTGRLKDLIVVDGRNHYPQDIEETVQSAHPAVRRDRLAAFPAPGGDGEETLVVVAEHPRDTAPTEADRAAAAHAARTAVSARHGLRLADFRLVPPGTVPRTSSGKISRAACRRQYLDGTLTAGGAR